MHLRKLIINLIFLAVLIISGCAGTREASNTNSLTGEIVVVGNEPFTNLALMINSSEIYILNCDDKAKEFLLGKQGKTAKVYFEKVDDSKTPKVLYVTKQEILPAEGQ